MATHLPLQIAVKVKKTYPVSLVIILTNLLVKYLNWMIIDPIAGTFYTRVFFGEKFQSEFLQILQS